MYAAALQCFASKSIRPESKIAARISLNNAQQAALAYSAAAIIVLIIALSTWCSRAVRLGASRACNRQT